MERRGMKSEAEWQTAVSEVQALKRKLQSKSEALLIISKDLDATLRERDQFKMMSEKLRVRCQAYKRQFSDYPLTKDQASLIQMLRDTKNQKIAHQKQSELLQQKLNEALGDVKLLRERFARQRVGDEGAGPRHFPAHEREELVTQLETAKQQAEQFRQELNIANDQLAELMTEKAELSQKSERLNQELNFMLNGDKKRIIDIDALCMENKYLQERVKQCQEEKNSLHAQMSKLKAILNARKTSSADIKPGKIRNSGLVISPKQVKELLMNRAGIPSSAETVSDLESIAAALLETINDKNLALHHLRNTNKILGKRVAELEMKLKTLEVAGLWTLAGQSQQHLSSSTPKIETSKANLGPMENENEFFSSLGSRLTKLTDVCDKSFREHKLISLTPESSSSASDVIGLGDEVTKMNDVTKSDSDVTDGMNTSRESSLKFKIGAGFHEENSRDGDVINSDSDVTQDIESDITFEIASTVDVQEYFAAENDHEHSKAVCSPSSEAENGIAGASKTTLDDSIEIVHGAEPPSDVCYSSPMRSTSDAPALGKLGMDPKQKDVGANLESGIPVFDTGDANMSFIGATKYRIDGEATGQDISSLKREGDLSNDKNS